MKKYLAIIVAALCVAQSQAGNIWFTNANPYEPATMELYTTSGAPSPSTLVMTLEYGESGLLVFSPSLELRALESSGTGDLLFNLPSIDGDYTCNFDFSDPPTFTPTSVPEPTAVSLFMLGFATTFGTGMMANGARWVRNVVIGSSNE